jgi:hypothetical protein
MKRRIPGESKREFRRAFDLATLYSRALGYQRLSVFDTCRVCSDCTLLRGPAILSTSLRVTISSMRHGGGAALQVARPQSAKHVSGLLPGVGTRCVRFFPPNVRDRADGQGLRYEYHRVDLRDYSDSRDASNRRIHLWVAR